MIASYNVQVRRNFANPAHAGELQGQYALTLAADVSESDTGARVTLVAGVQAGVVAALAYRVWGCPHLIAALELVCTRLEGQSIGSLEKFKLTDISQELCIPVEKSGRILLLEDALAALWAQYASAGD